MHSFEKHEHLVCKSQNITHFDTHTQADCSVFHFKINNNTIDFSSTVLKTEISIPVKKIVSVDHQFTSEKPQHKSSRAPPYLLI